MKPLLFALLLAASPARAQDAATLAHGFTPDPHVVRGQMISERPFSSIAPECRGFVGATPAAVLDLETAFPFFRVFVTSPGDVSVAVRRPDGRFLCRAERLEGAPYIEGAFERGRVEVWVTAPAAGTRLSYDLYVTEMRSVVPGRSSEGPAGGASDLGLEVDARDGRFRGRRFRRGFLPNPQEDEGVAEGTLDARRLGSGCSGNVDARPSHVLTLRDEFDYFRIEVAGRRRTTLIVRNHDGSFLCHTPREDNAFVAQDAWRPGRYPIWVGSAEPGAVRYRISYSEVQPGQ